MCRPAVRPRLVTTAEAVTQKGNPVMTHVVLEQLASQRQAELATRATRRQRTRQPRPSGTTASTPRAQSGLIAARLFDLVGRS